MSLVVIEGWFGLAGSDGPTCGSGFGLTGLLNEEPTANILIGIQARETTFAPYLANWDGETVYGPTYTLGEWLHIRAELDFENRIVQGFVNNELIGTIPFTEGIGDEIAFINLSLGSNQPTPISSMISYYDGLKVAAGPGSGR